MCSVSTGSISNDGQRLSLTRNLLKPVTSVILLTLQDEERLSLTVQVVCEVSLEQQGDDEAGGNRRSALGALMGLASGVVWGSIYGLVHPTFRRISPAARSAGLGMAVRRETMFPRSPFGRQNQASGGFQDGSRT
jgi:hypothetical protein